VKKVVTLLVIGLVASFAVVAAGPAAAKKGHPKAAKAAKKGLKKGLNKRFVHGVVASVGSNSVTLTVKKGASVTIQVNADTKIVVNGEAGTLADIQVGYHAGAKLTARGGPAKVLRAHAPPAPGTVVHGVVASVGPSSITLTKKDGSSVTVAVNGDTKIRVNGKAGSLADIHAGFRATVRRTSADGPAAAIHAVDPSARPRVVIGVVDAVGSDSITIKQRNGATAAIAVNADTKIKVAGHGGSLSDIQVGYRAIVLRAGAGGPALRIIARPPKA
jgi:antitoxin component of MazEF toxin-antitoxin module